MEEEKNDFFFEINGLIDEEFIYFKTDSKKIVQKIVEMMDDGKNIIKYYRFKSWS
jgi:hypothetical protein